MPTGHVSDINVAKNNLLFSIMQDDFTINIARVISDEIQKVVDEERVGRGERRGSLGFPALITALCEDQRVFVEPKVKIRAPIDLKFIQLHCTNVEEYPEQRNRAPIPPKSPSSPTLEAVEKRYETCFAYGGSAECHLQIYDADIPCHARQDFYE